MIAYVRKVIREVIDDLQTPDEHLDALLRLAKVELPSGLTAVDREWLGLWYEELLSHATASPSIRELASHVEPV